ncbi:MAG: hypothetical protein NTX59_03935 [Elusimicrobia bacterium]|nr:hypothetical protein [Elusimicrobiota bacterium]
MTKRLFFRFTRGAAAALAFSLCSCSLQPARTFFSTDTGYRGDAASDDHAVLGLKPVFIDHLGRHGSRYFTSDKRLKKMLNTLEYAESRKALNARGLELKNAILDFIRISDFENITPLAAVQQTGIADRMYENNRELFGNPGSAKKIHTLATFKRRTQDTRDALVAELASRTGTDPKKDFINEVSSACQPLRFFDCDQKYQDYKKARAWLALPAFKGLERKTVAISREVLEQFLTGDFVDRLDGKDAGAAGPEDGGNTFGSAVEMASCLYEITVMEKNLEKDIFGFRKLFSDRQLEWFEYLADYNDFYEKGPGVPGDTITFAMAKELLRDFLATTQRAIDDPAGSPAAELRFAHAETLIPFAALLKLEGASEQKAEYPFMPVRWKGADVSPMSANIQWILYRRKAGSGYRLKILLNERPVKIVASLPSDGFYYDWETARKFYENLLVSLP